MLEQKYTYYSIQSTHSTFHPLYILILILFHNIHLSVVVKNYKRFVLTHNFSSYTMCMLRYFLCMCSMESHFIFTCIRFTQNKKLTFFCALGSFKDYYLKYTSLYSPVWLTGVQKSEKIILEKFLIALLCSLERYVCEKD